MNTPEQNKTAEELGKLEAEKLYPVITTHNWYAKENAAYRNGFEKGHEMATASLRDRVKELEEEVENCESLKTFIEQKERIQTLEEKLAQKEGLAWQYIKKIQEVCNEAWLQTKYHAGVEACRALCKEALDNRKG